MGKYAEYIANGKTDSYNRKPTPYKKKIAITRN